MLSALCLAPTGCFWSLRGFWEICLARLSDGDDIAQPFLITAQGSRRIRKTLGRAVYDFDGDGKAEVSFKTAPGTKDGKGNSLETGPAAGADNTKDYRSSGGMVLDGPEWLTVFSGVDGSELATVGA
jgi:hypothetical protein